MHSRYEYGKDKRSDKKYKLDNYEYIFDKEKKIEGYMSAIRIFIDLVNIII
jgi:hypothetical protein